MKQDLNAQVQEHLNALVSGTLRFERSSIGRTFEHSCTERFERPAQENYTRFECSGAGKFEYSG